jgi:hypothetical protein
LLCFKEPVVDQEDNEPTYKVGKGKPPLHTRFKKGVCPNPLGRPKGARSLKTELLEELGEQVPLTEGGKRRHYSKQRIVLKRLTLQAMQGNVQAAGKVFDLLMKVGGADHEPETDELSLEDEEILRALLERRGGSK